MMIVRALIADEFFFLLRPTRGARITINDGDNNGSSFSLRRGYVPDL